MGRLSKTKIDQIQKLYGEGYTKKEIAKMFKKHYPEKLAELIQLIKI